MTTEELKKALKAVWDHIASEEAPAKLKELVEKLK